MLPPLPKEATPAGFENDAASQAPSDVRIARYEEIARLYADGFDASTFVSIDGLGARLFRRPLRPDEHERFAAAFERWRAALDEDAAIRLTLQAMLQSPQFLYRIDETPAARLAFFLWESAPDSEQADPERMLDDPRAVRLRWNFHRQWLGLDRVARDEWEPAFATAAIADSQAFLEQADGFDDVLHVFQRTAWLAGNSHRGATSPPMRGNAIQSRLLCLPPVSPPPDADLSPPMEPEGVTNRQRFEQRTRALACRGCHQSLNGLGFGFEHYASDGTWQDFDNGEPVDASGELLGTDVDGPFIGADGLIARLVTSRDVKRCAAQRWVQYALGRPVEGSEAAFVEQLSRESDLRALVLRVATEVQR